MLTKIKISVVKIVVITAYVSVLLTGQNMAVAQSALGNQSANVSSDIVSSVSPPKKPAGTSSDTSPGKPAAVPATAVKAAMPYIGTILGDNVYVRSGPASIYYPVGRLKKGQEVIVHKEQYGWAMIEPTPQCFSYISCKYTKLVGTAKPDTARINAVLASTSRHPPSAATGTTGVAAANTAANTVSPLETMVGKQPVWAVVTGNAIRVRAGSFDKVPPEHANQVQDKLNRGQLVQVIGRRGDFYKIVSRPNWFFWVSLKFIRRTKAVTPQQLAKLRPQISKQIKPGASAAGSADRKKYMAIARSFDAEFNKPLLLRNFAAIKKRLAELIKNTKSSQVKALSLLLQRRLNQAQLAQDTLKRSIEQDKKLDSIIAKINNRMQIVKQQSLSLNKPDELLVRGKLAPSAIFAARGNNTHYLVLDKNGNIMYYAVAEPNGPDLSVWLNKTVTMVGKVKYDSFGNIKILHVRRVILTPVPPAHPAPLTPPAAATSVQNKPVPKKPVSGKSADTKK